MKLGNWNSPPQVVYIRTVDNDPVISLSFNDDLLVLGDVNGELHIIDVKNLQFPPGEHTVTWDKDIELSLDGVSKMRYNSTLRTHDYRSFIWACKSDSYRLFSGDEKGKIIIHDFLMFDS